jgi:hypothetical protein
MAMSYLCFLWFFISFSLSSWIGVMYRVAADFVMDLSIGAASLFSQSLSSDPNGALDVASRRGRRGRRRGQGRHISVTQNSPQAVYCRGLDVLRASSTTRQPSRASAPRRSSLAPPCRRLPDTSTSSRGAVTLLAA